METVRIVPKPIIDVLESFKPTKTIAGFKITDETDRAFFPPDFIKSLYADYIENTNGHTAFLIPKMYLIMYRIIMKIPTLKQAIAVFNNDKEFQRACCFIGYYKTGHYGRILDNRHPSDYYHGLGLQGLLRVNTELLKFHNKYSETLHNLADEINYKKIALHGLLPSVWVEYYRKLKYTESLIDEQEFAFICSTNTGIEVIDELTKNIPISYRGDVRQDSALRCLELNIDTNNHDLVADVVHKIRGKYLNEYYKSKYQTRSLFSKVGKDGHKELWETISDPSNDFIEDIENKELGLKSFFPKPT